jgi:hypothetical protein
MYLYQLARNGYHYGSIAIYMKKFFWYILLFIAYLAVLLYVECWSCDSSSELVVYSVGVCF